MFYLLGAGASVDSGLKTYRGPSGFYNQKEPEKVLNVKSFTNNTDFVQMWQFLQPLYRDIISHEPGKTYSILSKLVTEKDLVLTQNIDTYASILPAEIVEMHGNYKTVTCLKCGAVFETPEIVFLSDELQLEDLLCECGGKYRPNIVLFEENLSKKKINTIYSWLWKQKPKYVIVIGTSLQFPYLRVFIDRAKSRGAKVIHINPDPNYEVKKGEYLLESIELLQII